MKIANLQLKSKESNERLYSSVNFRDKAWRLDGLTDDSS